MNDCGATLSIGDTSPPSPRLAPEPPCLSRADEYHALHHQRAAEVIISILREFSACAMIVQKKKSMRACVCMCAARERSIEIGERQVWRGRERSPGDVAANIELLFTFVLPVVK